MSKRSFKKWKTYSCIMNEEIHRAIKTMAATKGISMVEFIEEAVKKYLESGKTSIQ